MKGKQIRFKEDDRIVLEKLFGYNMVSQNSTSLDENEIRGRNVITTITRMEDGKVWVNNGYEISDLIAAGLVKHYKPAKSVMPRRITHWIKNLSDDYHFTIEKYNEMYSFIQEAYVSARKGGTQMDFLRKIRNQYREDNDRECAMFILSTIIK